MFLCFCVVICLCIYLCAAALIDVQQPSFICLCIYVQQPASTPNDPRARPHQLLGPGVWRRCRWLCHAPKACSHRFISVRSYRFILGWDHYILEAHKPQALPSDAPLIFWVGIISVHVGLGSSLFEAHVFITCC